MKKILLILLFITVNCFAQKSTKEALEENFKEELKINNYTEAKQILNTLERTYGASDNTEYHKISLNYFSILRGIKNEKTSEINSQIKNIAEQKNCLLLNEARIINLEYFKIMLEFSLLHHVEHRTNIDVIKRKKIADKIIRTSDALLEKLKFSKKEDVLNVKKKTIYNYNNFTKRGK